MNYIDLGIIIPLLWGAYKGFSKGLIIEIASIVALVLGGFIGMHYSETTSDYIANFVEIEQSFQPIVAFAVTFFVVVLSVYLLAKILEKVVNFVAMKLINKISGAFFGLIKAAFLVSLLLVFIESVDSKLELIPQETKTSSMLYEPIGKIAPTIIPAIKEIDVLQQTFDKASENINVSDL